MMRRIVLGFWIGVAAAYVVLTLNTASTAFDVDVVPTEANAIGVVERVDQGPLSRMLSPTLGTLGTVRFTKRGWGILTTYSQELTVTAARLAQQAGTSVGVRVSLQVPGTITGTNATGRDGRTLVWGGRFPRMRRCGRARGRSTGRSSSSWPRRSRCPTGCGPADAVLRRRAGMRRAPARPGPRRRTAKSIRRCGPGSPCCGEGAPLHAPGGGAGERQRGQRAAARSGDHAAPGGRGAVGRGDRAQPRRCGGGPRRGVGDPAHARAR